MTQATHEAVLIQALAITPDATAGELHRDIYMNAEAVAAALQAMCDAGIVTREAEAGKPWRYALSPAANSANELATVKAKLASAQDEIERLKRGRDMAALMLSELAHNIDSHHRGYVVSDGTTFAKAQSIDKAIAKARNTVRAGSRRARVYSLQLVGESRPGAEWKVA
ncbi:hypothetical protein [Chitinimonas sp.]|uniref:hypothetical protein n=1 Tax=Chitinimonas sp. TaxID=1934313 RepID=UPI0035AF6476